MQSCVFAGGCEVNLNGPSPLPSGQCSDKQDSASLVAIWLQHKQGTLAFPGQTVPRTAPAGHCQHTQKHRAAQGWHACGQLCMASSSVMFHLPFECTAIPFVTGLASLCPFSSTVPCPAGNTGLLDSTTPCSQQYLEGPWLLPGCTTKLVETHQQRGFIP